MPPHHLILPGLTSTSGADWRSFVVEAKALGLTQAALFPTVLKQPEREELYAALEQTTLQTLPHVHARDDFEPWEFEYFTNRWQTEVFNLHPSEAGIACLRRVPQFASRLFLENTYTITPLHLEGLKLCGGLCLDFSHWEDFGVMHNAEGYDQLPALVTSHTVGCCHLSAIVREGWWHPVRNDKLRYNRHFFERLEEFDYLAAYRPYFPRYLSLELENPLAEQLQVKAYLEQTLHL